MMAVNINVKTINYKINKGTTRDNRESLVAFVRSCRRFIIFLFVHCMDFIHNTSISCSNQNERNKNCINYSLRIIDAK